MIEHKHDVADGPCACGGWHKYGDLPAQEELRILRQKIKWLEETKESFPACYPHGTKLSSNGVIEHLSRYVQRISSKFVEIEKLVGTQTDCQCQGEPNCKWCQIRKILES